MIVFILKSFVLFLKVSIKKVNIKNENTKFNFLNSSVDSQ